MMVIYKLYLMITNIDKPLVYFTIDQLEGDNIFGPKHTLISMLIIIYYNLL